MALIGNKLYRNIHSKQEAAADLDKELSRMEEDIRKLKIDFDIFFNGATKRPPLEARARLESYIKRVADNRNLTFAQRYQFNMLVARFTSYRELWRRTLKAKGEELA
jgi:cation diffusion facilitator CzcD-associated flavoprotein CzcO